ncbi:MAG: DUF3501 family protein [Candidatus Marinimicrobia bacterium]|nr:DUF3501 family protein [Candidatus Neomarinimicrobiota bacterium]MCF7851397.1 DUF3501 family protein [Candidatus Neomarinimicrobiota bacterium]MCF7904649.1 DUF3501 family protein [Candidatus Neomarinimicrobiota bacterium]
MNQNIVIDDLLNIIEYEKVRDDYRRDILDYKKVRRLSLGPHITITFENVKTMKFQIQEMMRAERMVHDEQIQEEIDIYNSLLPKPDSLSATLFIEVSEEAQIKPVLNQFIGLTHGNTVYFQVGDQKVFAEFEAGREEEDRISSVHYVQFPFTKEMRTAFLEASDVILGIDYRDYDYQVNLSEETLSSLKADL